MRFFILFLLINQVLLSQTVRIQETGDKSEVIVSEADYKFNIDGPFIQIDATITVYNKSPFQNRATFFYKLPNKAVVSGFALDIHGKMRQASAVEKDKARIAFETEVRGKVDPALIEWNQGNIFQTQIYPIAGNGYRKITVSYIIHNTEDFEIPLEFTKLKKLTVRTSSTEPISINAPIAMNKLSNVDGSYVEMRAENCSINGSFKGKSNHKKVKLYTEKNKDQNLYWIYKEPVSFTEKKISLQQIESIAVFQDISLSRESADLEKELKLLKAIINESKKPVTLKLFRFNVSSEFFKKYQIDSEDSFNTFAGDYNKAIVDGGTDFSKIIPSVKLTKTDLKLIFSDGLNNYANFATDETVFSINSSKEFDSFTLSAFGDKIIDLNNTSTSKALDTLMKKPLQISTQTPDTFVEVIDGLLIATGILKAGQKATFSVKLDGTELKKVMIKPEKLNQSDTVRKFWSQNKLQYLMKNNIKNKREIIELGKSHNLVTPYTSMIVLETLNQYLSYEIRPSDEEPDLQALYDERYKAREEQPKEKTITKVLEEWKKYKAWWMKYSDQKKDGPALVKLDKKMTAIDRELAQRRAEEASEQIYNEEFFQAKEADTPNTQEPENPATPPEESSTDTLVNRNSEIDKLLETLNDKQKPIKEKLAYLDAIIEELNRENDQLKNDNGRLKAENRRFGAQLSELKELYVKSRSASSRSNSKASGDSISFSKWSNKSVFAQKLTSANKPYEEYLSLRKTHKNAPGFYFECANYFLRKGEKEKAFIILSNIIEISNRNSTLMRMAAYKMVDTEYLDEAIYLFREIVTIRPEEPHSYRDLALALAKKADITKSSLEKGQLYSEALNLYKNIIESTWYRANEFRGLSTVLVEEYNNLILKSSKPFKLDVALKDNLAMDLRVVISWDSDMTDVDLHIVQPNEEKVYYGNRISKAGGRMSYDYMRGLGPETFVMRYSLPGEYKIYGKISSADALFFNGQISVKIDIYLNYGRPNQVHKSTTVKISERRKEYELAKIKLE